MTRTEQHLAGYDSARGAVQGLLKKYKMKMTEGLFKELVEFAEQLYYKHDGKDWSIHCDGCKFYQMDCYDYSHSCTKRITNMNSFEQCVLREEKPSKGE